jgi:secernin
MKWQKQKRIQTLLFLVILFTGSVHVYSCDTWVAMRSATLNGFTVLAKNSDRTLFDCQPLLLYPRRTWPKDAEINLGRITIPQVEETYATLGSSPYWCWGYEEGINEFGVAIGNEGIWTKVLTEDLEAHARGKGLAYGPTGMDLLRLGLERGKTAREALEVITHLVEEYGQFGSGIPMQGIEGAYHNSFIIADPDESWILETAGTHWIAKKMTQGVASISNTISIEDEWDLASDSLIVHAVEKGWWDREDVDNFDFSEAYADDTVQRRMQNRRSQVRANRSCGLLEEKEGQIDIRWMMRIARDRNSTPGIDLDQTASSCVAVLPNMENTLPVFWWTPAVPSSGCYVPFFVHGNQIPEAVSRAGTTGRNIVPPGQAIQDGFADNSYWWLFRDLTDLVNEDWKRRNTIVRYELDQLEKTFEAELPEIIRQGVALRSKGKITEAAGLLNTYTAQCVAKVTNKVNALREQFRNEVMEIPDEYKPYVGKYTADQNRIFTVKVQNNHLALDIPGQMVFELADPDDEGKRQFLLIPLVAVSFDKNESGRITALRLYQTTPMNKKAGALPDLTDVPPQYHSFLGDYAIPGRNEALSVLFEENRLLLNIPGQGRPALNPPDKEGILTFIDKQDYGISFVRDDSGKVITLNMHQTFVIPRGESAAWIIEKTIEAEGIQAAVELFEKLKTDMPPELFFDEAGFNALGYRLLNAGKVKEAIEIFKCNVKAYP